MTKPEQLYKDTAQDCLASKITGKLESLKKKKEKGRLFRKITCNQQRFHPGRRLRRLEQFIQVLFGERGLSSALALQVLLLTPLLVLESRETNTIVGRSQGTHQESFEAFLKIKHLCNLDYIMTFMQLSKPTCSSSFMYKIIVWLPPGTLIFSSF